MILVLALVQDSAMALQEVAFWVPAMDQEAPEELNQAHPSLEERHRRLT